MRHCQERKEFDGHRLHSVRNAYSRRNERKKREIVGDVINWLFLFFRCRAMDMEKMADMKYGQEKENYILYDYMKLGAGIVAFDLLRTKHTNVIPLDQLIAQSSTSKGAAFILYNVARLQSILTTFDEHVSSGNFNKLPALDQIDFTLLKEEVRESFHGFPTLECN